VYIWWHGLVRLDLCSSLLFAALLFAALQCINGGGGVVRLDLRSSLRKRAKASRSENGLLCCCELYHGTVGFFARSSWVVFVSSYESHEWVFCVPWCHGLKSRTVDPGLPHVIYVYVSWHICQRIPSWHLIILVDSSHN